MTSPIQRRAAGLMFLAVFALNGLCAITAVALQGNHAVIDLTVYAEDGCDCACCGEHCEMGALCCCSPGSAKAKGMHFAPLACGPGHDGPVPELNFIGFRYLPPQSAAVVFQWLRMDVAEACAIELRSQLIAPPTPPPQPVD